MAITSMFRRGLMLQVAMLAATMGMLNLLPAEESEMEYVPWRTSHITMHAQQREIQDLLEEFARLQGLPLSINEKVTGKISGVFEDVESKKLLDAVCEAHGLQWFFDGTRLYVDPSDVVATRPVPLTYLTRNHLEETYYSIGCASGPPSRECEIRAGHREGLIMLVGGPQFIRATESLARDLEEQEATKFQERMEVRSFQLKYASAADVTVRLGDQSTMIPGVASVLSNLMLEDHGGAHGAMATGPLEYGRSRSRPSLRGLGLAGESTGNPLLDASNMAAAARAQQQAQAQSPQRGQGREQASRPPNAPMIVMDARLNAVLVRDYATRMPLYEELIAMLDKPTKAIEITAAIVDIDSAIGRQIGVELLGFQDKNTNRYRVGFDADRGLFDGVDIEGQRPSFIEGADLARGVGLNTTALLSGFGYELLGRLRALEEDGKAQIVSSPSVLTMENVQAVIRTDEKVYVRVAGNMETDLYDVATGVQFRVTPSLVRDSDGGAESFRLTIEITDGSFLAQTVDAIPGTRESSITTQAMVPNNKTLLLGGYFVERKVNNEAGVPIISKIPVLGKVVSRRKKEHERKQRFFFITPRLVDLDIEATPVQTHAEKVKGLEINDALPLPTRKPGGVDELARKLATESIRSRRSSELDPALFPPGEIPDVESLLEQSPANASEKAPSPKIEPMPND